MKKQLILGMVYAVSILLPMNLFAQSTEGTEFWATFLQADHRDSDNKSISLSLTISARETSEVTIDNPYFPDKSVSVVIDGGTAETKTLPFKVTVNANQATEVQLYTGTAQSTNTNNEFCYTRRAEVVDSTALHVTATKPVSLYASNYKPASFDAANILPVSALQKDYLIQCYTPSDHGKAPQGTHFAVIATEDDTKVWYTPSVLTPKNAGYLTYLANKNDPYADKAQLEADSIQWAGFVIGEHTDSVVLQKGQVYYVWTGDGEGYDYDLSGSRVKADKPIAVLQGNPHTNLPYHKDFNINDPIQQRDHLFSQAMPLSTWGNTFAITRSSRKRDVLRIMAQEDGTEVRINGVLKHTFDFSSSDPKEHNKYWEIQIGDAVTNGGKKGDETRPDADVPGGSCFIETSCPCAVHLFIVSQQWDGDKNNNGDPAMLWVNPIEQRIDQITFSTFGSKNGTTYHYVNVVTDSASVATTNKMLINGDPLTGWQPVVGSDQNSDGAYRYYYVRHQLTSTDKNSKPLSYTLKREGAQEGDGFIAYVYGFTSNESYGYNAGGATKPLTQYVTINGEIFTPESDNTLCGEDTIKFACHPDYAYTKMEWNFGDGKDTVIPYGGDTLVPHYYEKSGTYPAFVKIFRESSNLCAGQNAVDSIPIRVTIGRYQFSIGTPDIPCPEDGKQYVGRIPYTNEGKVDLKGDNVTIKFNDAAQQDGFKDNMLVINEDYFEITIPNTAKPETQYGIDLKITSNCGGADTTLYFMLNFDNDVIDQRYNNVLGLLTTPFAGKELSDFQWYRTSDSTAVEGQVTSNLNFYDLPSGEYEGDAYYVCFTINKGQASETKTCACAKAFSKNTQEQNFGPDSTGLKIEATYSAIVSGGSVFVNADYKGQTDIECTAQWIDASGHIYNPQAYKIPDGGCIIPAPKVSSPTLYLLRVVTGKGSRSFKFLIQ
jgi:hypothetical protein